MQMSSDRRAGPRYPAGKEGAVTPQRLSRREFAQLAVGALSVGYLGMRASVSRSASVPARSASASSARSRAPMGFNTHILQQPDAEQYVDLVAASGATALRDEFPWQFVETAPGRYDWSRTDKIVGLAAAAGLQVLMIADQTPLWATGGSQRMPNYNWLPPKDIPAFGRFCGQLAARYGTNGSFWEDYPHLPRLLPCGIEIWNEENSAPFWGNRPPQPRIYADMLDAAYGEVKSADPDMTVIMGGLAPAGGFGDVACQGKTQHGHDSTFWNPVDFLAALYQLGARQNFDAVGWHPYNFWQGASSAQMLSYSTCSAWSQLSETPVSVRSLMTSYEDESKPVWITEMGSPSWVEDATYPYVTESEQARLAATQLKTWGSLPWAGGFFWYEIRDEGVDPTGIEGHFGAVRRDNTTKPVYDVLASGFGRNSAALI
jgi:hypothetical protein